MLSCGLMPAMGVFRAAHGTRARPAQMATMTALFQLQGRRVAVVAAPSFTTAQRRQRVSVSPAGRFATGQAARQQQPAVIGDDAQPPPLARQAQRLSRDFGKRRADPVRHTGLLVMTVFVEMASLDPAFVAGQQSCISPPAKGGKFAHQNGVGGAFVVRRQRLESFGGLARRANGRPRG